jgi:hypothetical protein
MYVGVEKINKLICGAGAWLDEPARGIEMGEQEKGGGVDDPSPLALANPVGHLNFPSLLAFYSPDQIGWHLNC